MLQKCHFTSLDGNDISIQCNKTSCAIIGTNDAPIKAQIPRGLYHFEVWGAPGGDRKGPSTIAEGGKGGYTSGIVSHTRKDLFLYIGRKGENGTKQGIGGFNGGGTSEYINTETNFFAGGAGGGGGTDITTKCDDSWRYKYKIRSNDSLSRRIIVAGGGGGAWAISGYQYDHIVTSNGGFGGGETSCGSGYGYTIQCNKDECGKRIVTSNSLYKNSISGSNQKMSGKSESDINKGGFGYGGNSTLTKSNNGVNHFGTGGGGGTGYAHVSEDDFTNLGNTYYVAHPILLTGDSENIPNPYEKISNDLFDFQTGAVRITVLELYCNVHRCTSQYNHHSLKFALIFIFLTIK